MESIKTLLILIPALPLIAALVTAALGPRYLKTKSHVPIALALLVAFVCSLVLWGAVSSENARVDESTVGFQFVTPPIWTWANVSDAYQQESATRDLSIGITLRADGLTAMMLTMVTFISFLVVVFAAGYMRGDSGYWRFFAYVSLFVFSMTMLVSVSNFLLLYVFWEAVGVCSYLLIGFWYQKPEAAAAGKKAFLVNRIGDFGFALAIFLIWTTYGTLNFHDTDPASAAGVLGQARLEAGDYVGGAVGLSICLLLLVGACGKSAQFPLHVWLPDAMEGPTPVSALIHAATMVTAGVYMVARCTPLFMASPDAQLIVAVIGGVTALLAGLIALTQNDLKRVLAYSTVSQLGYMFLALGTGSMAGIYAGMFHLFTHAFFKALLFLGSGSVMHAMGGVIDMRRFSGLRKLMPITHWTFFVGCLALAGIPPLSGFWSKDAIVAAVHDRAHEFAHELEPSDASHGHDTHAEKNAVAVPPMSTDQLLTRYYIYQGLFYVALFTAFLTAFYTFRAFYMTFYGDYRVPDEAGHHAHESPPSMWGPLVVLAGCACFIGFYFGLLSSDLISLLGGSPSLAYEAMHATTQPGGFHASIAAISSAVAVAGMGLAAFLYLGETDEVRGISRITSRLGLYQLSLGKFFFDEIYNALIVAPLRGLATVSYWIDRWIVDGLVNLLGRVPLALGWFLRSLQMGLVQFYALAMVLGLLVLLAARIMLASG